MVQSRNSTLQKCHFQHTVLPRVLELTALLHQPTWQTGCKTESEQATRRPFGQQDSVQLMERKQEQKHNRTILQPHHAFMRLSRPETYPFPALMYWTALDSHCTTLEAGTSSGCTPAGTSASFSSDTCRPLQHPRTRESLLRALAPFKQ